MPKKTINKKSSVVNRKSKTQKHINKLTLEDKNSLANLRMEFKLLSTAGQFVLLQQILEEHAYYSAFNGMDWLFESIDNATLRANKAEGKLHKLFYEIEKMVKNSKMTKSEKKKFEDYLDNADKEWLFK